MSCAVGKEREGKGYRHLGAIYRAAPVVVAHPAPVVEYHPQPAPQCRIVYETRYSTKCKKIPRQPYKPCVEYRKEYQTKCYIQPRTCRPIVTTVPDEACHTETDKHCTVEVQTTYDVSYQEQCEDIEHKVCQHTQVIGEHKRPAAVGHPVVGHAAFPAIGRRFGKRVHKREAASKEDSRDGKSYNPLPIVPPGPRCQVKVERNCHKVPIKVPRHIEIPHCTKIPRTKCIPSFRTITDSICKDEPREVCAEVEIEVPFDVPIEYCPPVIEEVCHKVPRKVAQEVCPDIKHHY